MKTFIFLLLLPLVAHAGLDVAFLGASEEEGFQYLLEAIEYLESDPRIDSVSYVDCRDFTPSVEFMQNFDVLLLIHLGPLEPEVLGDNLADYVDGGGFVISIWDAHFYIPGQFGIGGRWLDGDYAPYRISAPNWYIGGYQDLNILEPEHPIFEGVSYLIEVRCHMRVGLLPGASEVADFTLYHGIAINAENTVVGFAYIATNPNTWVGDGFLIVANAACWLAGQSAVREMSWGEIKAQFE